MLKKFSLYKEVKKIVILCRKLLLFLSKGFLFQWLIVRKFYENDTRKIHLGCGERILKDWLNIDVVYPADVYMNLNKKLPFKDNSIDFVYSHHVIEHLSPKVIFNFLEELHRICKPGAKIRLVTPDLNKLIRIYKNPENHKDIIKYYCEETRFVHPTEFLNQEMRQGGEHTYTFDFDYLKTLLREVGFKKVTRMKYGESATKEFDNLDFHGYKMIDRISLAVEAEK